MDQRSEGEKHSRDRHEQKKAREPSGFRHRDIPCYGRDFAGWDGKREIDTEREKENTQGETGREQIPSAVWPARRKIARSLGTCAAPPEVPPEWCTAVSSDPIVPEEAKVGQT